MLPPAAFFEPTFQAADLERLFESSDLIDLSDAYATHLWEAPGVGAVSGKLDAKSRACGP